jgi:hypothetical protein
MNEKEYFNGNQTCNKVEQNKSGIILIVKITKDMLLVLKN